MRKPNSALTPFTLPGDAHSQILVTIVIEIAYRERRAEEISWLV
jgi:hypothetical protein